MLRIKSRSAAECFNFLYEAFHTGKLTHYAHTVLRIIKVASFPVIFRFRTGYRKVNFCSYFNML